MTEEKTACQSEPNPHEQMQAEQRQIRERMKKIKHQILVLSGKGGVGKSTVAVNLAISLALSGRCVGLLDIDIHGPSVPKILNLEGKRLTAVGEQILPVEVAENLKVMSIGFLLQTDDDAIIWRGPMKYQMIKQFLKDVEWGSLDFLVIDSPPGTGDEPLSVVQLLEKADGAVVVTTPQELALADVRKSINFCRNLNLTVLGVLENMSGFVCPKCGQNTDIFKSGGGQSMAAQLQVPFLGRIPIDPEIVRACDSGRPYVKHYSRSRAAKAFKEAIKPLIELDGNSSGKTTNNEKRRTKMRIAIPLVQGRLSAHFGHCEQFAIIDVDTEAGKVTNEERFTPPAHEPGALPKWLSGMCVDVIIAGGMGQRAQQLFAQNNIKVVVGAPDSSPEELTNQYITGRLQCGENICDH
jgi:ATP-binding protein involved in chromosome partitioning